MFQPLHGPLKYRLFGHFSHHFWKDFRSPCFDSGFGRPVGNFGSICCILGPVWELQEGGHEVTFWSFFPSWSQGWGKRGPGGAPGVPRTCFYMIWGPCLDLSRTKIGKNGYHKAFKQISQKGRLERAPQSQIGGHPDTVKSV